MAQTTSIQKIHRAVRRLTGSEPVTVTARGDCMVPWIENGARLQVTPVRFYWPGDVIVFQSASGLRVHRMIGFYRRRGIAKVLTRADSGYRPDAAVPLQCVLGKVTSVNDMPLSIPLKTRIISVGHFTQFVLDYVIV